MKKLFSIFLLVCITLIVGCEKNDEMSNPIMQSKSAVSDIPVVNGMLSFQSFEEYEAAINAIASDCENYAREYYENVSVQLGTDDEDLINEQMQREGFSQFEPIHQFEKKYGIKSYHSILEELEKQWMESPMSTDENHPFANTFFARYQSALHNLNGDVLIAGEVFNPENEANGTRDDCAKSGTISYSKTFTYKNKPRKLVGILRTVSTSVSAESYLYTITSGGGTNAWTSQIHVDISGYKLLNDCYYGTPYYFTAKQSNILGCAACVISMVNSHPNYISKQPVNAIKSGHRANNANVGFNLAL